MTTKSIKYKGGYKYQIHETLCVRICIKPAYTIDIEYLTLDTHGDLYVKKGYAWDGPSGPTFDTPTFMRGSVIHDALYQLIREGHLSHEFREAADRELRRVCLEDGMHRVRAWWVYWGVRLCGGPATASGACRGVCVAPRNNIGGDQ